jgi:hypothetical protein
MRPGDNACTYCSSQSLFSLLSFLFLFSLFRFFLRWVVLLLIWIKGRLLAF